MCLGNRKTQSVADLQSIPFCNFIYTYNKLLLIIIEDGHGPLDMVTR